MGRLLEFSRHLLPEHMNFRVSVQLSVSYLSVLQSAPASKLELQLHVNRRQSLVSRQTRYAQSGSYTTSSNQAPLKLSNYGASACA